MWQAIQIESTTREKRRRWPVEASSEESGIRQNHIFIVSAKEEENGRIQGHHGRLQHQKL